MLFRKSYILVGVLDNQ